MSWVPDNVVEILSFLLPGFVSAAVFYSLTSYPRPSDFVSVVHALIFTMVVQALVFFVPIDGTAAQVAVSVPVAILVGTVAAAVTNHDKLYTVLRWLRITRETSFPSEWYSSFANHERCYVVLHLQGQRRLYGWLEEWPSQPDKGHFRLGEASWLDDDMESPLDQVAAIMVPADHVEMVEFLQPEIRT